MLRLMTVPSYSTVRTYMPPGRADMSIAAGSNMLTLISSSNTVEPEAEVMRTWPWESLPALM